MSVILILIVFLKGTVRLSFFAYFINAYGCYIKCYHARIRILSIIIISVVIMNFTLLGVFIMGPVMLNGIL
jgi:hypothetical protein